MKLLLTITALIFSFNTFADHDKNNGNGIHIDYWKNGNPRSILTYKKGNIIDVEKGFFRNGKLKYLKPYDKYGTPIGIEQWFCKDGQLQHMEIYKNGRVVYEETFFKYNSC